MERVSVRRDDDELSSDETGSAVASSDGEEGQDYHDSGEDNKGL